LTGVAPVTLTLYLPLVYSPTAPLHLYLPMIDRPDPLAPINPHPAYAATEQSPNAYLAWSTVAPAGDGLRYDVYLEANNPQPGVLVASGLTKAGYDPATFAPDTQVYWRVVVSDDQGRRTIGPVWTFRVEPIEDPPLLGSMIPIPAGEFLMGCDRGHDQCVKDVNHQEEPLHAVYLDAYEIDKYEVTNVEYRACTAAGACPLPRRFDSNTREEYFYNSTYDLYPVLFVSWWDAQAYCSWVGKRLPTEAEWEKAARGPIDTRKWTWGEEPLDCQRANTNACVRDTVRVGSYPTGASPYGLMDMAGNVFEWVADKYDVVYYTYSPYANPQGPERSRHDTAQPVDRPGRVFFVLRGGSFSDRLRYNRVAHRHWGHHGELPNTDEPYFRNYRVGFRCARSIGQ
jgi:formylglycine-generating enzyme required for sulfatase activity